MILDPYYSNNIEIKHRTTAKTFENYNKCSSSNEGTLQIPFCGHNTLTLSNILFKGQIAIYAGE